MSDAGTTATPEGARAPSRQRPWIVPALRELPKLTKLTLASLIGGSGGTGGGGSTVFALLLTLILGATVACTGDGTTGPGAPPATLSQAITCRADVATAKVDCGRDGPQGVQEIVGSQGDLVALRSSNVSYDGGTEIFRFDVTVQNLASVTLGHALPYIDVFFQSGPTVTAGSGTATVLNEDGEDTYTGPNQPYFRWVDSLQTGQTTAPKTWQLSMPPTVTSFTFTVLVSATVRDYNTGVLVWAPVPEFLSTGLIDIAVNSSTDAMAVGYNDVLRKVGSSWQRLPVQVSGTWVGVEPVGNGQYLGATSSGGIYLFNGAVWNKIEQAPSTATGFTAEATGRFAVGNNSQVDWFGSTGWHSYAVSPGAPFDELGIYAPGVGVTVNHDGWIVRFNFDSTTPDPFQNGFLDILTLGATPTVGFMWGVVDAGAGVGYIYDDAIANYIYVATDTAIDALAYGPGSTRWAIVRSISDDGRALNRWSGGVWSRQATLPAGASKIFADSAGGFYIISSEGIHRWNGSTVVDEVVGTTGGSATSLAAMGSSAIVGTDVGNVRWFRNGSWEVHDADPDYANALTRVAVAGPDAAYALDNAGHLSGFEGVSWNNMANFLVSPNDILAFADGDLVLVGGNGWSGDVYRRDGGTWSIEDDLMPGSLNAVWGQSIDDLWAVGESGKVVHFTGGLYTMNAPGTIQTLRAVTGNGTDVWVAGDSGYIAHWDGSSWIACTLGSGSITALWSPSPGFVYASTDSGAVNAEAFTCGARAAKIPAGYGQIQEMAGDDPDRVWALKGGVVYRGSR